MDRSINSEFSFVDGGKLWKISKDAIWDDTLTE